VPGKNVIKRSYWQSTQNLKFNLTSGRKKKSVSFVKVETTMNRKDDKDLYTIKRVSRKKYFEIKLLKKNSHNSVVLISQKKLGKKLHKKPKR